jgi:FixJ family two-component response regulator
VGLKRIFILDDDKNLGEIFCQLLDLIGVDSCVKAESLRQLQADPEKAMASDVAFLDVNLGDISSTGLDAYRWLMEKGYHGQIVFFSGHARSHPMIMEVLKLPNVRFIEKPVSIAKLEDFLK